MSYEYTIWVGGIEGEDTLVGEFDYKPPASPLVYLRFRKAGRVCGNDIRIFFHEGRVDMRAMAKAFRDIAEGIERAFPLPVYFPTLDLRPPVRVLPQFMYEGKGVIRYE